MKVRSVEFVKSVTDVNDLPRDGLPELAIAGRSNVGKSSLINCLLNRKNLARTSSTPGKTRQLNYFRINNRFYFVDLPGYGFARVSKKEAAQWRRLIESYVERSPNLRGVLAIIDSRIGPTDLDLQLLEWLKALKVRVLVVSTKADKLSRGALLRQIQKFQQQLGPFLSAPLLAFSAATGSGKREVWREIVTLLE